MRRDDRLWMFLSLAIVLAVFADYARADYPAVSTPGNIQYQTDSFISGQQATRAAACAAIASQYLAQHPDQSAAGVSATNGNCLWNSPIGVVENVGTIKSCSNGATPVGGLNDSTCAAVLTCPQGGTLQGTTCVVSCNAGEAIAGYIPGNANPGTVCFSGCEAGIAQASNSYVLNGVQVIAGTWIKTGAACTGGVTGTAGIPQQASQCPAGQAPGLVNGAATCLPVGPNSPAVTFSKDTSSTTNTAPNGTSSPGSSTTTTKTETNNGSGVTVSSTSTTTNPDGSRSTTTSTAQQKPELTPDDLKGNPGVTTAAVTASTLYQPKSKTVGSVLSSFRGAVMATPVITWATGLFALVVPAAACPVYHVAVWSFDLTMDQFCTDLMQGLWTVISALLLLASSWLAFRWAVL